MLKVWDKRRDIAILSNQEETLQFAVEHLVTSAKAAIADHGAFYIALSGGSTPKAIFERLCQREKDQLDWSCWHLFWSDERSVPPTHPDSNYRMAMEAGFKAMPIPQGQIHRMQGEGDIEAHAALYEQEIKEVLQHRSFDLMMLGMGDDGHTASLFPQTHALSITDRWVVANYVPQHKTWRMTLTFPCINQSHTIVLYVIGEKKQEMLRRVLCSPEDVNALPSQHVGTVQHKALWIADAAAAALL